MIFHDQPNAHYFLLHQLHLDFTYSNAAGETFVWRARSVDHISLADNGDLIDNLAGRNGFDGIIGRIVFNIDTGEVLLLHVLAPHGIRLVRAGAAVRRRDL